jgi:hypothetical protein
MASQGKDQFVADGEERIRNHERRQITAQVAAKYASELAEAGFFRRWCIRWHVRREIETELKRKSLPPETLYAMGRRPCEWSTE